VKQAKISKFKDFLLLRNEFWEGNGLMGCEWGDNSQGGGSQQNSL